MTRKRRQYKLYEITGGKKPRQTRHSQNRRRSQVSELPDRNAELPQPEPEEEQVDTIDNRSEPVDQSLLQVLGESETESDTFSDTSMEDAPSVVKARPLKLKKRKRKVKTALEHQYNNSDWSSDEPQSSCDSTLEIEEPQSPPVSDYLPTSKEAEHLNENDIFNAESSDDCQENMVPNSDELDSEPLCECTNVTVGDIMFMTVSVGLRHGLSWDAQVDILKMWGTVFGGKKIPLSKPTFIKKLNALEESDIEYHVYCHSCDVYMGKRDTHERFCVQCDKVYEENPDEEFLEKCVQCAMPLHERQVKVSVIPCNVGKCGNQVNFSDQNNLFVSVSIESQLQKFVKDEKFVNNVMQYRFNRQYIPGIYSDVYDGEMYQKYFRNNGVLSSPYNFSYTFFTDGIPYSKSGGKSVWPIYLTINELPYEERRRYFILAAVYCGPKEPDQNWLFEPFVKQANGLSREGFKWIHNGKTVTSRVIPLCLVADSGARSKLINFHSYAGLYGCTFCYHMSVARGGRKFLLDLDKEPAEERTAASYRDDLKGVWERRFLPQEQRHYRGVKGPCVLNSLHYFSVVDSCIVDYMHCILVGCVKHHMELILSSRCKKFWNNMKKDTGNAEHAMKNLIASIDEGIKKIQSNTSVIRELRLLKDLARWKASEFRSWLLFYCIVCLKGFLKEIHLEHLALLSIGSNLLLQKTVTHCHVETSLKLFKLYALKCQELWGEEHMLYNIHLLGHIPKGVLRFGPIWSHNAFSYESKNRHILTLCKSPHHLPYQVARKFLIYQALPTICSKLVKTKKVVTFCDKIMNYKLLVKYDRASDINCVLLGKPTVVLLSESEIEKVSTVLGDCCASNEYYAFERMYYRKKRYTTNRYGDGKKNNDSYAILDCGQCVKILRILKCPIGNRVVLYVENVNILRKAVVQMVYEPFDHVKRAMDSGDRIIVNVERLDQPCFRLQVRSKQYIAKIPYGCTVE